MGPRRSVAMASTGKGDAAGVGALLCVCVCVCVCCKQIRREALHASTLYASRKTDARRPFGILSLYVRLTDAQFFFFYISFLNKVVYEIVGAVEKYNVATMEPR